MSPEGQGWRACLVIVTGVEQAGRGNARPGLEGVETENGRMGIMVEKRGCRDGGGALLRSGSLRMGWRVAV